LVINIRYYIITISSIFLALGIGIFIGFMFDAQKIIVTQKQDIVSQLEERFNYLKGENEELKEDLVNLKRQNSYYEEFSRIIFADLLKDRLKDINVAIIETNDDYIYSNIAKVLKMAGANVESITTIKDNILTNENGFIKIIENIEENNITQKEPYKIAIEKLINSIVNGKDINTLFYLNDMDIIDIQGNYITPVDYIIIAGGAEKEDLNKIKKIDWSIIDYCKKVNIPIIGVEKEIVKFSYIEEYKKARISTVDNVDSVIGQVSLILAMEGKPGNYGIKKSAESLMPSLSSTIN
jgi:hypothetical protein